MNARLNWYGEQAIASIKAAGWEGIVRATEFFHAHVLQALNVPNSRETRIRTRKTSAGPKGSTYSVYPSPSQPGEPPRKRTGFLQAHVQREYDQPKLRARVGITSNALYGLFLEIGTKFMHERPWLLATAKQFWAQLKTLASSGEVK